MAEQERVAVGHGDGVRPSSLERMYHRGGKSLAAVAMLATGMFGMFTPGARSKEEQAIAGSGREIERVVSAGEGAKEQSGEVSALELLKSEASGVESNRPVSAGLDLARIFSRRVGLTRNTEAVSAVVNLQEQLAAGRHLSDLKLRVTGREVRPVRTVESVKQSRAEAKPKVVDGITKDMVAKAASSRPSASKSSTSRAVVKDWDVAELSAASAPEAPLGVAGINIAERLTLKWKASLSSSEWTLIDGNDLIVKEMTDGRYEILYLHDGALPAGFFQVGLNLSEGEPECELLKVNAMSLAGSAGVAQLLGARSLTELPAGALPLSFVAMVVLKPQVEYPHDMVLVPGRRVTVGTDNYYRSEGPAVELDVPSVLVSRFEISIGFAAEQLDYLFQEGVLEYLDYWNGLEVNYDSPHPLYTGDYIAMYGMNMNLWEYNPADYPGLTKEEAAVVAASNTSYNLMYITDGHIRPLPGIENYPYRCPVAEMFTIMNVASYREGLEPAILMHNYVISDDLEMPEIRTEPGFGYRPLFEPEWMLAMSYVPGYPNLDWEQADPRWWTQLSLWSFGSEVDNLLNSAGEPYEITTQGIVHLRGNAKEYMGTIYDSDYLLRNDLREDIFAPAWPGLVPEGEEYDGPAYIFTVRGDASSMYDRTGSSAWGDYAANSINGCRLARTP